MYVKRAFKKRVAARKPYKRTVRKTGRVGKSLTKAIKSVISKQAETKIAFHSLALTSFNSGIDSIGDENRVLPNIIKGTSECERIGEQVRLQRMYLKGHMILSSAVNNYNNSRLAVRMMVVTPKNQSGFNDVTDNSIWLQALLRKGAANVPFTGTISDLYAEINKDFITCFYDKVTYITIPFVQRTIVAGVTSVNTATESSIDLANATKFFNISFKVKNKLLRYDSAYSTTQPSSYAPILVVGYVHLDGSSPDVATTALSVAYDSYVHYQDL